jgi:hypothetical protein
MSLNLHKEVFFILILRSSFGNIYLWIKLNRPICPALLSLAAVLAALTSQKS